MKRKTNVTLLMLCIIVGLLSACGTKETVEPDTTDSVEVHMEELPKEPTTEPTTETSEPTTEETVVKAWAEENNITLSAKEVEIPYYAYAKLDGVETDEIDVSQFNAKYFVPTVTVTDADEEGYVIYTVEYKINFPYYAEIPVHITNFNPYYTVETFYAMDYYTGIVFASSDLTEDNEQSYNLSSTFEWDGNTNTVSVAENGQMTKLSENAEYIDDTRWKLEQEYEWNGVISILAPKDYDGLVLYLDMNGSLDNNTVSSAAKETHIFGEVNDETIENGLFIRVADLIAE